MLPVNFFMRCNLPTYSFLCKACEKPFTDLQPFDPKGKYSGVVCPFCKSKKKKMLPTIANLKFADPKDTSKWDNFSYRAGYNLEAAQDLRTAAEATSHMGTEPYSDGIDDINRGDLFGEVK